MANTIIVQRDTQLERQRAGFIALSLTNFTNDDEPTISAGSVVEISGSLYSVTSNQSITGWGAIANGQVWVKLAPDGTNPFTAEYTSTAPTWFDSKQGWYDDTGTDRYVAGLTKTGVSGYAAKFNLSYDSRGSHITGDLMVIGRFPFTRVDRVTSTSSWVVPAGVYQVMAIAVGGGAGGGGQNASPIPGSGLSTTVVSALLSVDLRSGSSLGGNTETDQRAGIGGGTGASGFDILISGTPASNGSVLGGRGGQAPFSQFIAASSGGPSGSAESGLSSGANSGCGGSGSQSTTSGAGGGSAGAAAIKWVSVSPGDSFTVTIGAGGAGGGSPRSGGAGGSGFALFVY